MNHIAIRRRWLQVRPWATDSVAALLLVLFVAEVFAGLKMISDFLHAVGWTR